MEIAAIVAPGAPKEHLDAGDGVADPGGATDHLRQFGVTSDELVADCLSYFGWSVRGGFRTGLPAVVQHQFFGVRRKNCGRLQQLQKSASVEVFAGICHRRAPFELTK